MLLIYVFVKYIDFSKRDCAVKTLKTEGGPSFNTIVFLKIYLYGYLNGVRIVRDIEKECLRNIEMQWLLEDNRPNYQSITDFRKIINRIKEHFQTICFFLERC